MTKQFQIGKQVIGNHHPILVQSMTKTKTADVFATVEQIKALETAGCQIIRCAIKDEQDAVAIAQIKKEISIPLVADIHFNHQLALTAIKAGADKIRINPGNIAETKKVKAIVEACLSADIPIRVGVNSGSLEKDLLKKHQGPTAEALVESALRNVELVEKFGQRKIVISIKATSVPTTIKAYRLLAQKTDYPLHVGITEAGIPKTGIIRSAVGIGSILAAGIGDTIRVSLTGNPLEEVRVAQEILKALELVESGPTVISCPTCGRTSSDIEKIATIIEDKVRQIKMPLKIAIMGCEVNGPGEAAEADIGLAAGQGSGLIFKSGKIVRKVKENDMIKALLEEIERTVKANQ